MNGLKTRIMSLRKLYYSMIILYYNKKLERLEDKMYEQYVDKQIDDF